jgi:sulfatase modifying factor 1
MQSTRLSLLLSLMIFVAPAAQAVTIATVPVGNPGNAGKVDFYPQSPFGAVPYRYRIGKYEVTNSQYAEFLNAVDPAGANLLGLYVNSMSISTIGGIVKDEIAADGLKYVVKPGREQNPVVFVSWYDTIRFANWLHNGQGTGGTETGAYTLEGGTPVPSNGHSITRNPSATWFLPTENEWYKAAFHKNDGVTGNYWDYATATNITPYSDQPPGSDAPDPTNVANFGYDDGLANGYNDGWAVSGTSGPSSGDSSGDPPIGPPFFDSSINYLTDIGAYWQADSPYGTFDQGGNLGEWTETLFDSSQRVVRGGYWSGTWSSMIAWSRSESDPAEKKSTFYGFRVASSP